MTMAAPARRAMALLMIALVCSGHVAAFHTAPIAPLRSAKSASPSLRGSTATRAGLPLYMSSKNNEVRGYPPRGSAYGSAVGVGSAISRRGASWLSRVLPSHVCSTDERGQIVLVHKRKFPELCPTSQAQKQVAAALVAALMGATPAFAADAPAPAPPAAVAPAPMAAKEEAKPAASGGVQNWRYSEFIDAVNKNKVEKVRADAP